MIVFREVEKFYRLRDGLKVILDRVSLTLPNRNIGILGGNGAGKSTLLRMISGAEKPNAGDIDCQVKVSFPLGFAGSFNGSLSGLENALFVSRIYGQDTDAVIEYVKDFTQLGEQLYMPFKTYSSGMRARLAFGVSLAIDFECYLVDEITAVGDARFRKRSREAFMSKLDRANILMVSHGMGTLREYCEAGIVLHEGKLTYYDDLEEAIRHHNDNMGIDETKPKRRPGAKGGKGGKGRPGPGAKGGTRGSGGGNAKQANVPDGPDKQPAETPPAEAPAQNPAVERFADDVRMLRDLQDMADTSAQQTVRHKQGGPAD